MSMALLILGMALCSFLPRWIPLVLLADREMPPLVKTLLGHTPHAVLAALVAPALLAPTGDALEVSWSNPYLLGGAATFAVGAVTKKFGVSTAAGVAVFYLCRWLLG
ncbi:AzlD domain-containing protein [Streptomyces cinnabarinus]|uniref:AzlD domain-containing protein n=1 Tax=Streptomyces cinnabarinus TaxID=67287 RepID=A0ABY7KDR7_9ACTN|nr:AzlD domain-containing protein [Streptomyces cinnabarinus]WAZ21835.1 AzlD domain-containing protein [Streptomyces cinnabarinus]